MNALTTLALIMLLAVRIHLEVINVTVRGDLLDSTAKQVDTISIFLILLFSFFCSVSIFRTFAFLLRVLYLAR